LAAEARGKRRGAGGTTVWERATRFLDLRSKFSWNAEDAVGFVNTIFDPQNWIGPEYHEEKAEGAALDLELLRDKTLALLEQEREPEDQPRERLRRVVKRLRHLIATNESLDTGEPSDLQVTTLWGAKGVTAEHVYIIGACAEALPGQRREEYPGTDADYYDEQQRLFYVSITRTRKTLVISRALHVGHGLAKQLGLTLTTWSKFQGNLRMSPFLHDIMNVLPHAVPGDSWGGCVQK
jgi:superfamily I DNA/RNA helicase